MSAYDTFESFTASLSQKNRDVMREFIVQQKTEMLAARSEDARNRLVQNFIEEVHQRLHDKR